MSEQELQTKAAEYAESKVLIDFDATPPPTFQMVQENRGLQEAVKYGYELAMAEIKNNPEL